MKAVVPPVNNNSTDKKFSMLLPILSQINQFHISSPRFSKLLVPLMHSNKNFVCFLISSVHIILPTCYEKFVNMGKFPVSFFSTHCRMFAPVGTVVYFTVVVYSLYCDLKEAERNNAANTPGAPPINTLRQVDQNDSATAPPYNEFYVQNDNCNFVPPRQTNRYEEVPEPSTNR